jgi:hypothetical protein
VLGATLEVAANWVEPDGGRPKSSKEKPIALSLLASKLSTLPERAKPKERETQVN